MELLPPISSGLHQMLVCFPDTQKRPGQHWCPRRFAESQDGQAVLLHPTSSGLHLKGGVCLCRTGSLRERDSTHPGVELATLLPPLGFGLLGSGSVCAESAFSRSIKE